MKPSGKHLTLKWKQRQALTTDIADFDLHILSGPPCIELDSEPLGLEMLELLVLASLTVFNFVQFLGTLAIHFSWQLYPQSTQWKPRQTWGW